MDNPPGVAPADDHLGLLANPRPGGPQRRELAQGALVTKPDLPAGAQNRGDPLGDGRFFSRTANLA
jgi:hypothetical protein